MICLESGYPVETIFQCKQVKVHICHQFWILGPYVNIIYNIFSCLLLFSCIMYMLISQWHMLLPGIYSHNIHMSQWQLWGGQNGQLPPPHFDLLDDQNSPLSSQVPPTTNRTRDYTPGLFTSYM